MTRRPFARTSAAFAGLLMALGACGQTPKPTSPSGAGASTTETAPAPTLAALKYAPKIPGTAALLERKESGPGELAGVVVSGKTVVSVRHDFKAKSSELAGYAPGEAKASWKKTADGWVDCVGDSPTVCLTSNYEDGEWSVSDPRILNPASGRFKDLSVGPAGTFQFVGVREGVAYFLTWDGTKDVHVTGFDADGAPVADKNLRIAAPKTAAPENEGTEEKPSASPGEKASPTPGKAASPSAAKRPKTSRASSASPSRGNSPSRAGSSVSPADVASPSNGPSSNGAPSGTSPQKKSAHKPATRPPASQATGIRAQMTGSYLVVRTDSVSGVYFTRGNRFVKKDFDGACAALKDGVICETESGLVGIGAGADDAWELEADVTVLSSAVESDSSLADAEADMRSRLGQANGVDDAAPGEDPDASAQPTPSDGAGGDAAGKGTAGEGATGGNAAGRDAAGKDASSDSSDTASPLPPGKRYLAAGPKAPVLLSAGDGKLSIDGKRSAAIGEARVKGVDLSHDIAVVNVETRGKSAGESRAPAIVSSILVDGDGATLAGIDKTRADRLFAEANGGDVLRPYGFAWQGSRLVYTDLTEAVIGVYRTAGKGK